MCIFVYVVFFFFLLASQRVLVGCCSPTVSLFQAVNLVSKGTRMTQVLLSRGIKAVGSPSKINNLIITRELVLRLNFFPTVSIAQKFRSQCCNFRLFYIFFYLSARNCSPLQKERGCAKLKAHPKSFKHVHARSLCWEIF